MPFLSKLGLLDENGHPLSDRLEQVLCRLAPRLRRQFPALNDEVVVAEVLEEAARRITEQEKRCGVIEKLHGYAWVTIRHVAISRMRRTSIRLAQNTLESEASQVALSSAASTRGSPEEIERDVLLHEILAQLTPEERLICIWKKAGFSSKQIAKRRRSSAAAVDTLFCRVKQKIRRLLGVQDYDGPPKESVAETSRRSTKIRSVTGADGENNDGQ